MKRTTTFGSTVDHLVIFNYAMDTAHPIFGHQFKIALELSRFFGHTTVLTGRLGKGDIPPRIKVISHKLEERSSILALIIFLAQLSANISSRRRTLVFSHMTETHSLVAGVLLRIFRVPHILWYAHAHASWRLKLTHKLVDSILTSTPGSFPLTSRKLKVIGQGIDDALFPFEENRADDKNFVYFGRLDSSKQIDKLMQVIKGVQSEGIDLRLTLIGKPTGRQNQDYLKWVIDNYRSLFENRSISIADPIPREKLRDHTDSFFAFLHAFQGSLDKSLLEATLLGLHVVTLNAEFISEFGTYQQLVPPDEEDFLLAEVLALLKLNQRDRQNLLKIRREQVMNSHILKKWIPQVIESFASHANTYLVSDEEFTVEE